MSTGVAASIAMAAASVTVERAYRLRMVSPFHINPRAANSMCNEWSAWSFFAGSICDHDFEWPLLALFATSRSASLAYLLLILFVDHRGACAGYYALTIRRPSTWLTASFRLPTPTGSGPTNSAATFSPAFSQVRASRLMVAVSCCRSLFALGGPGAGRGLAGFYGGRVDYRLLNICCDECLSLFPGILLAIAFVAFLGPGLLNLVFALAIGGWVGYARLVRAQVLAVKEREFVEAARALGASDLRIFTRHILPNILQPIIVQSAIGMAGAVLAEATLSFLGLGLPPPTASWGGMLNDARSHLFDSPHMVVFPAIAVMLCVLSFNFIGDALRDYLDPRDAPIDRVMKPPG